jgi:phosphatidylserine/phosphatidylglycerophosphate/cardiolipin synthase-like enzyme
MSIEARVFSVVCGQPRRRDCDVRLVRKSNLTDSPDMLKSTSESGRTPRWAALLSLLAACLWAACALGQEIHYAPEERLDRIDVALIATAKTSIDLASYALTDSVVIEALNAAQRRGVGVGIVLDPRERHDFVRLGELADTVRLKRGGPFMHLKSYAIDGDVLRTGSANFSTSGENAQDNDLIVIRDPSAAAKSTPISSGCGTRRSR